MPEPVVVNKESQGKIVALKEQNPASECTVGSTIYEAGANHTQRWAGMQNVGGRD